MYQKMSGFLNRPPTSTDEVSGKAGAVAPPGGETASTVTGGAGKGPVRFDRDEEEEDDDDEGDEGDEDEEEEEGDWEQDEATGDRPSPSPKPAKPAQPSVAGAKKRSWSQWYMANYEWLVFAFFIIAPVVVLWPDLVAQWRVRMGWEEASAGAAGEGLGAVVSAGSEAIVEALGGAGEGAGDEF